MDKLIHVLGHDSELVHTAVAVHEPVPEVYAALDAGTHSCDLDLGRTCTNSNAQI